MKFLVDECTGPAVAHWLRMQGHEVFSVYEEARGLDDDAIMRKAHIENRILITNDKEFGEKVYRERHPHRGLILLRLSDERAFMKLEFFSIYLRVTEIHYPVSILLLPRPN
jgi:predicted nuclease of predicted toxin-antitoxin system